MQSKDGGGGPAPLVVRDPAMRRAGELLRGPALICPPRAPRVRRPS
ncbi:hypothetical protein BTZ20_2659 [Rhodococcus sp. MTM3W5.2]|nr:hypothetical protein BTZ20_2659 [Rhodococcus sp. MTM3W5.2]